MPANPTPAITMQDVRLVSGEGKLSAATVLQAVNAILAQRAERALPAEGVVVPTALEIAYGCLWRIITDVPQVNGARREIRSILTKEQKRCGVAWAVENLPAVSDAEIMEIDL